jgi:hypothetical protein
LHPVNAFEFDELDLGLSVSAWRCVLQVLGECTAFDPASGVTSKAANGGHFKTGQRNVAWD